MNVLFLLAALTVFKVDPWGNVPYLPDADPAGGAATDAISFAAAQGEFEAVSFVVRPDEDLARVDVVVSDLKGPGGAAIPASAADVALVKVWFHPDGRWNSSWGGNAGCPTPLNCLVLHDDALVKVDWKDKVNYLRVDYSDGPTYVNMSRRDCKAHFDHDLEPVRDAPKFVPFDLKKGFRQQYLVTWKVPKDAPGGKYAGTLALVSRAPGAAERTLRTLTVALEVYPFALPRPRTHYDTREPYVSYWMGSPSLGALVAGGHRFDRAERKLRAIYRNMADHNAINLSGVGTLEVDSTDDYALRTLLIARQEGMCADGLINGAAVDYSEPFLGGKVTPEADPARYRRSLDRYRAGLKAQNAILDKYLGHHRCYYSSCDECDAATNRRCYGYWSVVHELGGRTWTDYAFANKNGIFIDMNDVAQNISHTTSWDWRATGAKAVTYSATFTGPENPNLWRRVKGLRFWYADYDGQHEYNFFDGRINRWNDFFYLDGYCRFGIVYWTMDGLVSTLAWEAMREALDDVRYFSLLRLRAEAALRSSDPGTRGLGREALVWQDGVDPEYVVDLDGFRRETVGWILRLVAKAGPQPADVDTELEPPATLPPDSRWASVPKASAGAGAVFAYVEQTAGRMGESLPGKDRYDLALAALRGLLEDPSAAVTDRVRAACWASSLHSLMKERAEAVAVIDKLLAVKNLPKACRGQLLLKRGIALLTDEKFEEAYTARQLDEAGEVIAKALTFEGTGEGERAKAIHRMTHGYFTAGEFKKSIAYAEARLKDTTLDREDRSDLYIAIGAACNELKDWKGALKSFKAAHETTADDRFVLFKRKILLMEAHAAEMDKDYERAARCWSDAKSMYNKTEEAHLINAANANAVRLFALARKGLKGPTTTMADDDGGEISLDE